MHQQNFCSVLEFHQIHFLHLPIFHHQDIYFQVKADFLKPVLHFANSVLPEKGTACSHLEDLLYFIVLQLKAEENLNPCKEELP